MIRSSKLRKSSRIAMISYHTCPLASQEGKETGGMNVYVLELSRELVKQGATVDIYTRSQDANNPLIVDVVPGLRVIHLTAGPQKTISKKELVPYIAEFVTAYVDFVAKHHLQYDTLHAHYYLSGLIGIEIQKHFPSLAMVMNFHTLGLMKNLVARTESEQEGRARIVAEQHIVQRTQKIIAPSENEVKYLQYLYDADPQKIMVISPGIDTTMFRPLSKAAAKQHIKAEDEHKIVLFAGRIEPLKGIDVLMYAMKIVTKRHPEVRVCLWIVGGNSNDEPENWSSELRKLDTLRRTLQLDTIVRFVGQQPQSELPYYYNAAELVVMPSHYESFGMTAAEAMACGVPVLTTNVAGISNLLDEQHESLIISANNPLLLARQMERFLFNDNLHTNISHTIREQIQDLDWRRVVKKIKAVYDSVQQKG